MHAENTEQHTEIVSAFMAENDFMIGIPCDALFSIECPVLLGMNVIPGTLAVDNGTETTKLTVDVGMVGADDGMAGAAAAAAVGVAAGIDGATSDDDDVGCNGDGAVVVDDALLPKGTASADGCRMLPGDPLLIVWLWMTFDVLICIGWIDDESILCWRTNTFAVR